MVGVAEGDRTDEALVLNFTVQAENPNAEPIPLRDTHYALTLEGIEVFRGRRDAQATLRRYGSHTFTLPAVVPADRFDLLAFDAGRASERGSRPTNERLSRALERPCSRGVRVLQGGRPRRLGPESRLHHAHQR